jgi:3-dehydroquinate synthase
MLSILEANYKGEKYPIYISDNITKQLDIYLRGLKNNYLIICDDVFKEKKKHPDITFSKILKNSKVFYLKAGIRNKTIKYVDKIIEFFYKNNISRDCKIISIGGGVVGDIVAYASSIYHRGLDLIHIPTSMTSMIDSSIGGKTGFNRYDVVNLCGTYYHPKCTFIDVRFLKTLKQRDLISGLAEIIKKAIIFDEEFFEYLMKNNKDILKLSPKIIYETIIKSIEIKLSITTSDEKESNQRLLLNYGHTFGQAIEGYYGINQKFLTHGEAVSLGIVAASKLADLKYKLNTSKANIALLKNFKLPTKFSNLKIKKKMNVKKLIKNLNNDKKRTFNGIRFIISKKKGKGKIIYEKNNTLIKESFMAIIA